MNIGERIGDYEIVAILGKGGMGEVYKVRNLLSERVEAMKILLPNLGADPELAQRFLREIKLQASLDHPNIAKLHTAFRDSNQLLMVMEFVEGLPLEKLLANGSLLTHDAIDYAGQVLEALAYAHARGVVHRDIKPANLMRTPSGAIKLLDFGIAHMKADLKLTQPGATLGSLFYIAPELIQGAEPDARCDIYSLGVVLYEMVTGRKPFQGDNQYSILAAHMQGMPIAPADAAPWVPGPLNDVILRAMAKDPAGRFQSAEAFKGALENAAVIAPDQAATQVMPSASTQALPASTQATPIAAEPPRQAAVAPPMPLTQPNSGHRGLYVALGSFLTLAVLAAAAMEGPKFFKTHADQAAPVHQTRTPAVQETPAQDQAPGSTSVSTSDDQPSPAAAAASNQPLPASQADSSQQKRDQQDSNQPSATPPALVKRAAQTQPGSQAAGPSAEAQQSYRAQMGELQDQADHLDIRARTARAGLSSIKAQMSVQGLGLRSDVVEAEARMNYLLAKAQREISSGDAVSAEHDLEMAGYAIDFIEKFLGR